MSEETIGTRIAKLRNEYSYSQEYVAEKLGVSRQAVSKWEQSQSSPDTENLIALSQLFNVSVEYLAVGKTQEQKEAKETEKPQVKSSQKVVGYILLSTGLLSLILGIILDFILIIVSAYFIASGFVCLLAKKHFLLIMFFTLALVTLVASIFFAGKLVRLTVGAIVLYSSIAVIIITASIALFKFIKKKRQAKKNK